MDANTTIGAFVEGTIQWMDWITIVFAFGAMFGSLYNAIQRRKEKDEIKIYIIKENKKFLMPISTIRKHVTRAEIGGILRALYMGGIYQIKYTTNKEYTQNIFDIQTGKANELVIKLEKNDKFEWYKN